MISMLPKIQCRLCCQGNIRRQHKTGDKVISNGLSSRFLCQLPLERRLLRPLDFSTFPTTVKNGDLARCHIWWAWVAFMSVIMIGYYIIISQLLFCRLKSLDAKWFWSNSPDPRIQAQHQRSMQSNLFSFYGNVFRYVILSKYDLAFEFDALYLYAAKGLIYGLEYFLFWWKNIRYTQR